MHEPLLFELNKQHLYLRTETNSDVQQSGQNGEDRHNDYQWVGYTYVLICQSFQMS